LSYLHLCIVIQSYLVFIIINILTIIIGFREPRIVMQWGIIELRILIVIPALRTGPTPFKILGRLNYFLSQAPVSVWILFRIIFSSTRVVNTILFPCLLFKLGLPPFTGWLFNLIKTLEEKEIAFILVLQKFLPLNIITRCATRNSSHLIISLLCGNFFLFIYANSLGNLKSLLVTASIAGGYWPVSIIVLGLRKWLEYLIVYSFLFFHLIILTQRVAINTFTDILITGWLKRYSVILTMWNVGGVPPRTGFILKAGAVRIICESIRLILILLILNSFLILYYFVQYTLPLFIIEYDFNKHKIKSWQLPFVAAFFIAYNPVITLSIFTTWT